ncbi:MAG: dihydroorotate dehydrogenase electron transfer subunit [Candidatus Thorarchaeota archaeon]
MEDLMGNPLSVKISEVVRETECASTVIFDIIDSDFNFAPGQFLMVWVPGVDEIPMSISLWEPPKVGLTVLPIGEATELLASLQPKDWIGIRGPFGSSFTLESQTALVVGGGIGMAPLRPLVYALLKMDVEVTMLIAAKTKQELIFFEAFSQLPDNRLELITSTDDGSEGFKGLATDAVKEILKENEFDTLYTCGPELMMYGLYDLVKDSRMSFQASLERFMKCGCGICGTCALDPTGSLVCADGPIYTGNNLSKISEFGKYHRDAVGRDLLSEISGYLRTPIVWPLTNLLT